MQRSHIAIVLVLIVFITSCKPPTDMPLDELIDVGTHKLHIHCVGAGSPKIIIDTGVGETYESWGEMIESLSRETRVCAYDRAGYGQSEPGPMPRDGQRAADELHRLMVNSGEVGPFLLIGHSLGALNMQVYAHSFPDEIAGLVLLDPPPLMWMEGQGFPELRELFNEEIQALREDADAAITSPDADVKAIAPFLSAVASEYEEFFGRTTEEVAAVRSFGKLPLTVIGASEPDPRFGEFAGAFRQFWNEESQKIAGKSEAGEFILAEGSSHHIHLDAPQLVMEAILEMLP